MPKGRNEGIEKREGLKHWWVTPVLLATQEAEIRGSRFKTSLGK
jgi:hypothetical protein